MERRLPAVFTCVNDYADLRGELAVWQGEQAAVGSLRWRCMGRRIAPIQTDIIAVITWCDDRVAPAALQGAWCDDCVTPAGVAPLRV
eukprot:1945217-Pyramimonas_sp.AAC.1